MGKQSRQHRADRLYDLLHLLRSGGMWRADDLAAKLHVTPRTIYRDMERLVASGVPVSGTPGAGYVLRAEVVLPPLSLTDAELEVLNLGLAVLMEAGDAALRDTAESLAAKIDAAQPTQTVADADSWKVAFSPFADASRMVTHLPLLRSAIQARQKVALTYTDGDGAISRQVVHPLATAYLARSWTGEAWCDSTGLRRHFRLDLIDSVEALPELFTDPPD